MINGGGGEGASATRSLLFSLSESLSSFSSTICGIFPLSCRIVGAVRSGGAMRSELMRGSF